MADRDLTAAIAAVEEAGREWDKERDGAAAALRRLPTDLGSHAIGSPLLRSALDAVFRRDVTDTYCRIVVGITVLQTDTPAD